MLRFSMITATVDCANKINKKKLGNPRGEAHHLNTLPNREKRKYTA